MLIAESKCLEVRAKLFFLCIAKATEIKKAEDLAFNDLLAGIKIILKSLHVQSKGFEKTVSLFQHWFSESEGSYIPKL